MINDFGVYGISREAAIDAAKSVMGRIIEEREKTDNQYLGERQFQFCTDILIILNKLPSLEIVPLSITEVYQLGLLNDLIGFYEENEEEEKKGSHLKLVYDGDKNGE